MKMDSNVYTVDLGEIEGHANIGRDVTLAYLRDKGYLTKEQVQEVGSKMAIIARKPSWFQKLFGWRVFSEKGIRFQACTVHRSPEGEEKPDPLPRI